MTVSERLRLILDREKITDKKVAEWLILSPQRLSQKFKDNIWDSITELEVIAENTGYSFLWLSRGEGVEKNIGVVMEPSSKYVTELERLRVENRELQIKYAALLEAFEKIGAGRRSSDRYVGQ